MTSGLSSLERATMMLERLRSIHPRMEMQTALMFLIIAKRPGVTKPQLESLMNMNGASSYRNLNLLKEKNLIHVYADVKGSVVSLTPNGERFAQSLSELIERGENTDGS